MSSVDGTLSIYRSLWSAKLLKKYSEFYRISRLPPNVYQRVAERLSEDEAWHLFYQILEALVHMGSMGIVNNPFIHHFYLLSPFATATP